MQTGTIQLESTDIRGISNAISGIMNIDELKNEDGVVFYIERTRKVDTSLDFVVTIKNTILEIQIDCMCERHGGSIFGFINSRYEQKRIQSFICDVIQICKTNKYSYKSNYMEK
jgi:hypothetical protein